MAFHFPQLEPRSVLAIRNAICGDAPDRSNARPVFASSEPDPTWRDERKSTDARRRRFEFIEPDFGL